MKHTFRSCSADEAPLDPELKLSTNLTHRLSRGTVVPPDATTATPGSSETRNADKNSETRCFTLPGSVGFCSLNACILQLQPPQEPPALTEAQTSQIKGHRAAW